MRSALLLLGLIASAGFVVGQDLPQDLSGIERKIAKEPEYKSRAPKYALMVLGEKASKRIWLVIDGDVLYADLNGNGDLTEDGEKISKYDYGEFTPTDGSIDFAIKEIRDGEVVHRDFYVSIERADRLAALLSDYKELLKRDPKALSFRIAGYLQAPGHKGLGLDGRKSVMAQYDESGVLQFSSNPANAPIVHFGGKLKLGLFGAHELIAGRSKEVCLGIGTPGVGPGTMGWVDYSEIPPKTPIQAKASFPKSPSDGDPLQANFLFTDRCCYYNLLGTIRVPEATGIGPAQIEFRLQSLVNYDIDSLRTSINVAAPKTKLTLVPVTKRIVKEYVFPHRDQTTSQIQFSPDGSRILAADYPGGLAAVWDVKTADLLTQFETGAGLRGSMDYLTVAPDWKIAYASYDRGRRIETVEVNGQSGVRATYNSAVRGWNLETGKQVKSLQHDPPRGGDYSFGSLEGKHLVAIDDLPGTFERKAYRQARAISLWNLESDSATMLPIESGFPTAFLRDGSHLVTQLSEPSRIGLTEIASGKLKWTYECEAGVETRYVSQSQGDNDLILGVTRRDPKTHDYLSCQLVRLDAETGKLKSTLEVDSTIGGSMLAVRGNRDESFIEVWMLRFFDMLHTYKEVRLFRAFDGKFEELFRVEMPERDKNYAPFHSRVAVSRDARWFAILVGKMHGSRAENLSDPSPLDLPQPQVWLISRGSGKIVEKMDLPQTFPHSVAFSPDGKSLAVSGMGRVLSLDISDLVGATTK